MHLLMRTSQHDSGWLSASIVFEIDVRLDLDAEEQHLFDKYALYDRVVYNSEDFLRHLESADEYRELAKQTTEVPDEAEIPERIQASLNDLANTAYNSLGALAYNILGKLSLQLTLQNLVDGYRVESQSLEEIIVIRDLVYASTEFLANYLQTALTFDGREDLREY